MKKTEQHEKQLELFFNFEDMTIIELALTNLAHTAKELMVPQAEAIEELLHKVQDTLDALEEKNSPTLNSLN